MMKHWTFAILIHTIFQFAESHIFVFIFILMLCVVLLFLNIMTLTITRTFKKNHNNITLQIITYYKLGVRFTPTAAGHVLGAAMFSIEIDGIRVLYTGDYSMEEDRHLMCAEVPPGGPPDVLIVESTFGVVTLPAREEREARFTGMCCYCNCCCYYCY